MSRPALPLHEITGLVLAGGRGSRMGGVDKGLQDYLGQPLALNALQRLAPQVGRVAINANRNLADYEALGAPVWPDPLPDFPGPLAGMLAGLARCETPYLLTVPCDAPRFPPDLAARLAQALAGAGADIALAATAQRVQPVFCLMKKTQGAEQRLARHVAEGRRQVEAWARGQRCVEVRFEDEAAFFNANTLEELEAARRR